MFEYGDLDKKPEALRKTFTAEVLRADGCLKIIAKHTNILKAVVTNADKNEEGAFTSVIENLLESGENQPAQLIANELGLSSKKKKNDDEKC